MFVRIHTAQPGPMGWGRAGCSTMAWVGRVIQFGQTIFFNNIKILRRVRIFMAEHAFITFGVPEGRYSACDVTLGRVTALRHPKRDERISLTLGPMGRNRDGPCSKGYTSFNI